MWRSVGLVRVVPVGPAERTLEVKEHTALSDRPPGSPRKCTTATGAGWGRGGMDAWLVRTWAAKRAVRWLAGWLAGRRFLLA